MMVPQEGEKQSETKMAMDGSVGIEKGSIHGLDLERVIIASAPKRQKRSISHDDMKARMETVYRDWVQQYGLLDPAKIVSKKRKEALRNKLTEEMRAYTGRITQDRALFIEALEEQYVERVKEATYNAKKLVRDIKKDNIAYRQAADFYEKVEAVVYENASASKNEMRNSLYKLLAAEEKQTAPEMFTQYKAKVRYAVDHLDEMKAHVAMMYAPAQDSTEKELAEKVQAILAKGLRVPVRLRNKQAGAETLDDYAAMQEAEDAEVITYTNGKPQPEVVQTEPNTDLDDDAVQRYEFQTVQRIISEVEAQGAAARREEQRREVVEELELRLKIGEPMQDAIRSVFPGAMEAQERLAREAASITGFYQKADAVAYKHRAASKNKVKKGLYSLLATEGKNIPANAMTECRSYVRYVLDNLEQVTARVGEQYVPQTRTIEEAVARTEKPTTALDAIVQRPATSGFNQLENSFFERKDHLGKGSYDPKTEEAKYKPAPWYATAARVAIGVAATIALAVGGLYQMVTEFSGFQQNVKSFYESQQGTQSHQYQAPVQEPHIQATYVQPVKSAQEAKASVKHKAKAAKLEVHTPRTETATQTDQTENLGLKSGSYSREDITVEIRVANPEYSPVLTAPELKIQPHGEPWLAEIARYQIDRDTTKRAAQDAELRQMLSTQRALQTYKIGDGVPQFETIHTVPMYALREAQEAKNLSELIVTAPALPTYNTPQQLRVFKF